jgi:glutamate carboxypeptidase
VNAINSIKPHDPNVRLTVEGELNRPPFFPDAGSTALFEHARKLAAPIGIDLVGIHAGGGSDGNFTAALGVPTLDGLGVDGAGAHTLQEHIFVSSIEPRVDLFAALLAGTTPDDVAPQGPAR